MAKKKVFNIRTGKGIAEVEGYFVTIPGFEQYKFFVHKRDDLGKRYPWMISEISTGLCLNNYGNATIKEAIDEATTRLNKYEPIQPFSVTIEKNLERLGRVQEVV